MATSSQPVVYMAPSLPVIMTIESGGAVLNMTTGGSGGAVSSVNGQVGAVNLDSADIPAAVVNLTDARTIEIDASQGTDYRVTLGGNRTLANPTNATDGAKLILEVKQDPTGGRTLAYGSAYEFSSSLPDPTLSTAPGAVDLLGFIYNATAGVWRFVAFTSGFAS